MCKTTTKFFPEGLEHAIRMALDHEVPTLSRGTATSIDTLIGC
ncbi:hypothetical protein M2315_003066 [Agrobacterium fabrum]|nr:hypothetical protein [Agrobacterium fabrum]